MMSLLGFGTRCCLVHFSPLPARCLDFLDGLRVLWDVLHQEGEDHHAGDQVGEVDDVGKGLLRFRYLNPCSDLFIF